LVDGTDALIYESGGLDYTFRLDEQGMGSFGVVPNGDYSALLTLSGDGKSLPPQTLLFRDAKNDQNPALTYGYTSGAAADDPSFGLDTSYCSVYVKVDPSLSNADFVHVTLDGGAYVRGFTKAQAQDGKVPLDNNGTASFEIVDKVAEKVKVSLDLNDGKPETTFTLAFNAFPSWKRHYWHIRSRQRNDSRTSE
jgi:hypothetical protein